MTLEEKVAHMQCLWQSKQKLYTNKDFDYKKVVEIMPNGMGQMARVNERPAPINTYLGGHPY